MKILQEDFLNPFDTEIDPDRLYNLASGSPIGEDIAEHLLTVEERGQSMMNEFCERLVGEENTKKLLFDPIKRAAWKSFADSGCKMKVTSKAKSKEIMVQRDILGLLAAKSQQRKATVNIDAALCYPLAPVPLSLATCDGTRRKTAKSKLFSAALTSLEVERIEIESTEGRKACYILDLAAIIRSIVRPPDTFRELAIMILREIPSQYSVIYIACDTYKDQSIKNAERVLRGQEDKFVIRTPDIRIPANFKRFLSNGDNKERMFELMEQVWLESSDQLNGRSLYVARASSCVKIENGVSTNVPELENDHEEADSKIAFMIKHATRGNSEGTVCMVRSSSGDIDIPVILVALAGELNTRVLIDNGTGKSRKILDVSACKLSEKQKKALLGLHSFTGNDYVSSILRKGKQLCWKHVKENSAFLDLFASLGNSQSITSDQLAGLERFVCKIFGRKQQHSVNEARKDIFWEKLEKDGKVIDLSLLPPCQTSLELHSKRANFVAKMWRNASNPILSLDDPSNHGWLPDMTINWTEEAYPEEIAELLIEDSNGDDAEEMVEDNDMLSSDEESSDGESDGDDD